MVNNFAIGKLSVPEAADSVRIIQVALDVYPEYSNAHYNRGLGFYLLVSQGSMVWVGRDPGEVKDVRTRTSLVSD